MTTPYLDDDEIEALTQRTRRPAQSRVLSFLGIEHKPRPDGSLVVLRAHVDQILGGGVVSSTPRKTTPCFDLVK